MKIPILTHSNMTKKNTRAKRAAPAPDSKITNRPKKHTPVKKAEIPELEALSPFRANEKGSKISSSAKLSMFMLILLAIVVGGVLIYQQTAPKVETKLKPNLISSVISFFDLTVEEKKDPDLSMALKYLSAKGIMKGYADLTFRSNNSVNRAELLKMLATSENVSVDNFDESCFKDVQKGQWFARYMCYAKNAGWINPDASKMGKVEGKIALGEALKIIITAKEWNLKEGESQELPKKIDTKAWFAPYLKMAMVKNLWSKDDLDPAKILNRKQLATLLFKVLVVDELKVGAYDQKYGIQLLKSVGINL